MKLNRESLTELKDKLYRGSTKRIQLRLKDKGLIFSRQYICRCLDPNNTADNEDIIEEAICFVEDQAIQKTEMSKRIDDLKYTT
jgi:hypothetical protein